MLSVPSTKTSMWSRPAEAAAGPDVSTPPSDRHPYQPDPSYEFTHSALSGPRAKTAMRSGAYTTAAGSEVIWPTGDDPYIGRYGFMLRTPPSDCHPLHCEPFQEFTYSALSKPRPKTSSRLKPLETAAGAEVNKPPSDCQPL